MRDGNLWNVDDGLDLVSMESLCATWGTDVPSIWGVRD